MDKYEILRKRLLYQCQHRGMREMDFLLGNFGIKHIPSMTYDTLNQLEVLLALPDQVLYGWFFERAPIPENGLKPLINMIQQSKDSL